jgi:hypothetical protein
MISALPAIVHTAGGHLSPLAGSDTGPGEAYVALVLMSGLCLAPLVMVGLGILCAAAGRRGRRIGMAVTVVIILFYALSLIGMDFTWPQLEYKGELGDTVGRLLLGCGGFLVLPWLVAFGITKVARLRSGTTTE